MTQFDQAYRALNGGQRQAVDTIDGPVLVVAGPGTGKTQLLGMRAANIVRTTDATPGNILCLTFTESAALEMRQRLISLMGPEGNQVAVHTFHNFGAEIINKYPEYFHGGARFTPAEPLASYELLREVFEHLPHNSPLVKMMNGEYTTLKDAQAAISHLKRAGIAPKELLKVLAHNQKFYDFAAQPVAETFAERLSKKHFPAIAKLTERLAGFTPKPLDLAWVKPLAPLVNNSLQLALEQAEESGKTTALTAWRNSWCEKNESGTFVFKGARQAEKLRALADIFTRYEAALAEHQIFDFDDMITLVAHTLEINHDLRLNLQEQYHYLMVDEFQDTNGAQLRLLAALTDNPVNEGRPNILAVGDDDQAIYAFQGAELSNIMDFAARYRDPRLVVLTQNYRSTQTILDHSRQVVTQAGERLETSLAGIRKQLTARAAHELSDTSLHRFPSSEAEHHWVAEEIKRRIDAGTKPSEIAVIARAHKQLTALVPYLHAQGIALNYERRNNVLDSAHIRELITLSQVVVYLGEQHYHLAEDLLPELLSYEFWGLKTEDLWQLSLKAYKQRRMWLELMMESDGPLHAIGEFLIINAHRALHDPADVMLDVLIGSNEVQVPSDDQTDNGTPLPTTGPSEQFVSPYRAFYFNQQRLRSNPAEYLTLLSNLRALRRAVANYWAGEHLTLRQFVDFIELCDHTQTPVVDTAHTQEAAQSVHIMTAHKAKGLEFGTVFVLSCQDDIWGRTSRRPSSSLHFPANLPIEPAGNRYDDAVRLFFVAMTRAKHTLIMTSHATDARGKETIIAEFLQSQDLTPVAHPDGHQTAVAQQSLGWEHRHINLAQATQRTLLAPLLQTYRLSATHLNNFVDVTRGGPQAFLLQNLLRFPQAGTPAAAFGHAIHAVLARAHTHLSATGERRPLEDILHDFELQLQNTRLNEHDFGFWLEKGTDVLQAYLKDHYQTFTTKQKAERSFAGQESVVDGVRLTGTVDLMDINDKTKTIAITDYKTGKSHATWRGSSDFDKIKLHKYKQQLMFYKLLVEHSRDYAGYRVGSGALEFVEPTASGQFHRLELEFDDDEMATFKKLLVAVWERVQKLDFTDVSEYSADYKGLLSFEEYLLT